MHSEVSMKPFDKKSTSGLAKKPEDKHPQAPVTGTTPEAKPDRAPQDKKHKDKQSTMSNIPMIPARPQHTTCGEATAGMDAWRADTTHGREHN